MPNLYQNPQFADNTAPAINATNLNALANCAAANQSYTITATLAAARWSNNAITVTASGVTSNTEGFLTIAQNATSEQANAAGHALIRVTAQGTNTVTLSADGIVPTVDIPVVIKVTSDGSMNSGTIVALMPQLRDYIATTVTLTSGGWSSSNTQTVSVTGVTANSLVDVAYAPDNAVEYVEAFIVCTAQGSGTLTFSCQTTPTTDIDVNVVIRG